MVNIAIGIPVYNQPYYLEELLESIRSQQTSHSVFIYDDQSTVDYENLVSRYKDLSIDYKRNIRNLGAMANMQFTYNSILQTCKPDYLMIMHEDDLLSSNFFRTIKVALSENMRKPALILSYSIDFTESCKVKEFLSSEVLSDYIWVSKLDLVNFYLNNHPIAFGSALYNTSNYRDFDFDFNRFGEFADRPFLLNGIGDEDRILLLKQNLYLSRSHLGVDNRWNKLKPYHVFNLLDYYLKILMVGDSFVKADFKKNSTVFIVDSYKNLQLSGNQIPWFFYLAQGWKGGFISLKYLLLKIKIVNRLLTWLLKRN